MSFDGQLVVDVEGPEVMMVLMEGGGGSSGTAEG